MGLRRFFCGMVIFLFACGASGFAQNAKPVELPKPQMEGGAPLMKCLKDRKTQRAFSSKDLPPQVLSDLLGAAAGVNRPDSGKRTAPTAMDAEEIDIYVAKSDGLYLYDAAANALVPVLGADIRALTGDQPFVKDAPVNLVFVADHAKMSRMTGPEKDFYSAVDTGFISQNVYLFCSSSGLATVVRGYVNKLTLKKAMGLRDSQTIILAQTVGYPK